MFRIPTAPLLALCIYSPVPGMESFLLPARGALPRPRAPQPHAARAGGAAPGDTPGSQITDGSAARSSAYLFTPAEDEDEPFDTEAPFDTPRWLPAEAGEEPQVERRPPGWKSESKRVKLKLPSARGGTSGGSARSSARARRQAQEEGACVGMADDCPMVMLGRLSVHCSQPRCEIQ